MKVIAAIAICAIILGAVPALATPIVVDPGEVGGTVTTPLNFTTFPLNPTTVDLIFDATKTLTFGPGMMSFALTGTPSGGASPLSGYLFWDDTDSPIPNTHFEGNIEGGIVGVDLPSETVWRGMRFEAFFQDDFLYSLIWTSLPVVGDGGPTPSEVRSWGAIKSLYRGE